MSTLQIISLLLVAAAAAYSYLPAIKWPTAKPDSMAAVEAVLRIRDTSTTPEVRKACTQLLQALLQ
jgi:hypothetical protein